MFSRVSCYFFVRPKRTLLELCVFLGRTVHAPQVRRVVRASKVKVAHSIQIRHRDEVEAPITNWLEEAYALAGARAATAATKRTTTKRPAKTPKAGIAKKATRR